MAETKGLSGDVATQIWDTLCANGAAIDRPEAAMCFVIDQSQKVITEYRFMGTLGFGGKFWRNDFRWYVNCYPENETPERKKIIAETNKALAELKAGAEGHNAE